MANENLRQDLLEEETVLRLTLDRPRGNILTQAMMSALAEALTDAAARRSLRLVVLRGAGGEFSFGASIEEHRRETAPSLLSTFHALVRAVSRYPVPIAALVEGRCLGGAFELVLCAHLVFATEGARFGCPEIKVGVFPPVLAAAGACRLGAPLAERLLLTGETISADEARQAGLVTAVFPAGADPEAALLAWYREHLRPLSAYSLRQTVLASRSHSALLAALGEPLDAAERRYVEHLLPSHDGNEGIEAFLQRREPAWRDE